jgi:L-alanine-DL-glutamate epimerase-like enolase superfamily enzyme
VKISKVSATWVHVPIPPERQHTSDFGRTTSFDSVIVKIVTDDGITGWGEAKAGVGSAAECAGLAAIVNQDFAPHLVGQPAGDISRLWDVLYNRLREGYAIARGHGLPQLGRRGLTICAIAAVDIALGILGVLGAGLAASAGGARSGCPRTPRAAGPTSTGSARSSRATSRRAASAR